MEVVASDWKLYRSRVSDVALGMNDVFAVILIGPTGIYWDPPHDEGRLDAGRCNNRPLIKMPY
jgi:hypothetical protein